VVSSSRFGHMYDNSKEVRQYEMYVSKKVAFVVVCIVLAILAVGLEMTLGKANIGFIESYEILWNHLMGNIPTDPVGSNKDHIIWDLRVPRSLGTFMIGAVLAIAGTVMQSTLKNPLADPYTTGISSGAALGAIVWISLGICIIPGVLGYSAIVINAFVFSLVPTLAIMFVSKYKRATSTTMILTGLGVMYTFSAVTSLLMLLADPQDHKAAFTWNIGTVGAVNWDSLAFILPAFIIALVVMQANAKRINVLAMNDADAMAIGVDAKNLRIVFLLVVSITVALCVSFTGSIGFIGLLAPHIVRIFVGSDNRYLIPASAAFGGMLLLYADCVAKEVGATGVPVGIITAAIGGPLFLYIIIMHRKKIWS